MEQIQSTPTRNHLRKQAWSKSDVLKFPVEPITQNRIIRVSTLRNSTKDQSLVPQNFKRTDIKRRSKKTTSHYCSSNQPVAIDTLTQVSSSPKAATNNRNIQNNSNESMYKSSLNNDSDHYASVVKPPESHRERELHKNVSVYQCSDNSISKVMKNSLDSCSLHNNKMSTRLPQMTFDDEFISPASFSSNTIKRNNRKSRRKRLIGFPPWCICIYFICLAFLAAAIAAILVFTLNPKKTTTSTVTTATTQTTTTLTTTTTAPYCATTCSGSFNSSIVTTTCSLYCDDGGGYYCRPASTYCSGQQYSPNGFGFCDPTSVRYTGACNTTDHCCVYDNYFPDYYCLSRGSCSFGG